MNAKQKGSIKKLNALLNNITLIAEEVDYISYQSLYISKKISAYDAYKKITSYQPKWIELLFNIRDFLGKIVGIKSINGFNVLDKNEPDIGNKVHFFTVIEKEENILTLVVRDWHLDVCVHIRIINANDYHNKLYLITSVKNHNLVGKLYMLPVSIMHPYIVSKLFENLNIKQKE